MALLFCGGVSGLKGHCEKCHAVVTDDFNATYISDDSDLMQATACCEKCGHTTKLFEDGHLCLVCEQGAAAREQQQRALDLEERRVAALERIAYNNSAGAGVQTFKCSWCGSPRPAGARFCPHCRLDTEGRSADNGAWDFGFHTG